MINMEIHFILEFSITILGCLFKLLLKSLMTLTLTLIKSQFNPLGARGCFQAQGTKKHKGEYMCICDSR